MPVNVNVDLARLPIIGGIIGAVESAQRQAVQSVTEQVARFKLVPSRLRDTTRRISRLLIASQQSTDAMQLQSAAQGLGTQYVRANANVDAALSLINSRTLNGEALAVIGAAALGMRSVLGGIDSLEGQIRQQEAQLNLGPLPASSSAANGLMLFALVGVLGAAAISYARPRR